MRLRPSSTRAILVRFAWEHTLRHLTHAVAVVFAAALFAGTSFLGAEAPQAPPAAAPAQGAPPAPARGTRRDAGHRERLGHLPADVFPVPRQRRHQRHDDRVCHPADDARSDRRRPQGADAYGGAVAQRHPEAARRRVHERPAARQRQRRRGEGDAEPVHGQRADARPGERPGMERLESRPGEHALPAGGRRAPHGGRRAAPETQVGVRHSARDDQQRAADRRRRPRVHGHRQRLHLLARRQDRLRLLVVPERLDRPQLPDGRRGQGAGQCAVGGVLRRRARQRLCPRRADRAATVEGPRRRSRRRPHHGQRPVSRRGRLRADLGLRGVHGRPSGLPVLHGARRCRGARREHRQTDLEDLHCRRAEAVEEEPERRAVVRARGWRRLECADDRSGSRRALRRHR